MLEGAAYDGAANDGAACLITVAFVVTGALVGDQSCDVVDADTDSSVLSGIMGTLGGGVLSLPPTGRKTGAAKLSLAM